MCPVPNSAQPSSDLNDAEQKRHRMTRLMVALSVGLPTLPAYVFELNELLRANPVDLKRVSQLISTDPSLSAQVLKLYNSRAGAASQQISTIHDAVMVVGPDRLRSLMLTCSLLESAGGKIATSDVRSFWHHSTMTAALSHFVALRTSYADPEAAYVAGLLHDLGYLLFLMVLSTEKHKWDMSMPEGAEESLREERDLFGMDHCATGRWIGVCWNFSPALIDVLEHHHCPAEANYDPQLVRIVATADQFCQTRGIVLGTNQPGADAVQKNRSELLREYISMLGIPVDGLIDDLDIEFVRLMCTPVLDTPEVFR